MALILLAAGCFLASYVITGSLWRYALRKGIMDIPNHRSSHTVPTPRGGGLSFVMVFLVVVVGVAVTMAGTSQLAWALLGGGGVVALVGWLDDKHGLSPRLRLVIHLAAGVWGVVWLGGLPRLSLGSVTVHLGLFGSAMGVVLVAWGINAFNFMDGINGLAAGEAVVVAGASGFLLTVGGGAEQAVICWALAAAVGGFLFWNFPKAKIFMGDAGSGLLGYTLSLMAVASERSGHLPLLVWVLLLAVFVVDPFATLVRRIIQGERPTEAHSSHAYQRAVQRGYSHSQVTSAILTINFGLVLIAYFTLKHLPLLLPTLTVVLMVLLLVWFRFART